NNANISTTGKTIEETYQKKTQLEHILLRPDTYIGSIEKHSQSLWVYENNEMVHRPISYVPGLYKIFDEILVNAADNKQRDTSMDSMKVVIDVEQNFTSVYNNGDGVPVEIHQEEKVYVPELIFGHLLTSSNYNDSEKKTSGGRNGYGAKLTNIFSAEFVIETVDGKRQKKYKQVSFVNGIATIKGGIHVDYIINQITNHVMTIVNKKNKNANLKAHTVKNYLWVFVNALTDNPAFDSQTKKTLTLRQSRFGSKCELLQEFLKKVAKSGVVENLLSWADFKQCKDLKKTDGTKRQRITGITKLEDANDAGGKNSDKCTLILTEGDSAKAFAMAGISVMGQNYYGVFPLRGKLLNVWEANHKQIMENAEIQNVKQILGLQHGKEYDSVKSLRYGPLMIMTDQGLGTSTSKEGKEYFNDLGKHKKDFVWVDEQDGDAIQLAFSKKKIEARKSWLRKFEPGTYLDQKEKLIKYSDFVNKELILFSMADLQRSIPSMVDGLKPGQRKILFCSFKRNFVKEAKVAQFSGYVSEHSAYHHGEQSLASTIIGMAQDFVGSNHINLLQPNGQFGTRHQDDDILLDYLNEDGQSIEPTW
ncbi:unnamed protein product, partial [Ilex paraguariensis]